MKMAEKISLEKVMEINGVIVGKLCGYRGVEGIPEAGCQGRHRTKFVALSSGGGNFCCNYDLGRESEQVKLLQIIMLVYLILVCGGYLLN